LVSPLKDKFSGFTLIEILVAMILLSMVTLVVATALRLSIESWERGEKEGEDIQVLVAIPGLMEKQLRSLVKNDPFDQSPAKRLLPFYGHSRGLSFFTSYAPQGSPWQGLMRVTYIFNEEEKTLYMFEQVITTEKDLADGLDPLSDRGAKSSAPISIVPGITEFSLTYSDNKTQGQKRPSVLKDSWKPDPPTLPTGLGVRLGIGADSKERSRDWLFRIGAL
jgi:prepilin-type N-terminal cleavage/methylation domain-containing protein